MRKLLAVLLPLAFCTFASAQQTLSNDSIIKMVKAGLSDNVVIATIDASSGQYTTTPDALIALKQAGVSDNVIAAMIGKASVPPQAAGPSPATTPVPSALGAPSAQAAPPTSGPAQPPGTRGQPEKPRVYLEAASKGPNRNAARDQSMEMSKDLENDCPEVRITINEQAADYTVLLNHIEVGLIVRDNQIQIANRDGDLISRTKEGGSIRGDMKKACKIILADWAKERS